MDNLTISIYHDTRFKNARNSYPVKLQIQHKGKQKYYIILHNHKKLVLSPDEFQQTYLSKKVKKEYIDYKLSIDEQYRRANDIIDNMEVFTYEGFADLYYGKEKKDRTVQDVFDIIIEEKYKEEAFKTSGQYNSSKNFLISYFQEQYKMDFSKVKFEDITPITLRALHKYMLDNDYSVTTLSIYIRALRAVFNRAIDEGYIDKSIYPYGREKDKYSPPKGKKTKKVITMKQIGKFYQYPITDEETIMARAFWFFSYVCNGMNMKDITELKYKQFGKETFTFLRRKSRDNSDEPTYVVVPITDYVREVINRYGNEDKAPDNYVFPILTRDMTARQRYNKLYYFLKFINKRLKPIAKALDFPDDFDTKYARHSFSTNVVRSGQSLEFVQKALGHTDLKTTQNYFAGFEDETLHQVNSQLLNFGSD